MLGTCFWSRRLVKIKINRSFGSVWYENKRLFDIKEKRKGDRELNTIWIKKKPLGSTVTRSASATGQTERESGHGAAVCARRVLKALTTLPRKQWFHPTECHVLSKHCTHHSWQSPAPGCRMCCAVTPVQDTDREHPWGAPRWSNFSAYWQSSGRRWVD